MTSTNIHVGLNENSRNSSKVLKPPGGGSSDIFGSGAPLTSRSGNRNHMASNIFATPEGSRNGSGGGSETGRRNLQNVDSHNRLFGEVDRPYTPAKNHFKSNIPIGGLTGPSPINNGNGNTNGNVNGNSTIDGPTSNGNRMNGHSTAAAAAPPPAMKNGEAKQMNNGNDHYNNNNNNNTSMMTNGSSTKNDINNTIESPRSLMITSSPRSINNNNNNGFGASQLNLSFSPPSNHVNNNNNSMNDLNIDMMMIKDNNALLTNTTIDSSMITGASSTSSTSPSSSSSLSSSLSNTNNNYNNNNNNNNHNILSPSIKSPRHTPRNPVTGVGCMDNIQNQSTRRTKKFSYTNRDGGNPVTGEGYQNKTSTSAEINTTVPSLNGSKQVINKNRVPPGGFSSGLW